MSCPCDLKTFPTGRDIPAGLIHIPRQWAGFPEVREAMLSAVRGHAPLSSWRARGQDDLGIMLLEMWAYISDNLAFYGETIAHESYLRTARRRPSLRKLVDLLGYLPRPAVAASVTLALIAEGVRPVAIPAGTAFRSGAFGDEAPQLFEMDEQVTLSPSFNRLQVTTPPPSSLEQANPDVLLIKKPLTSFEPDDLVMVGIAGNLVTHHVARVAEIVEEPSRLQLKFADSLILPAGTELAKVRAFKPTQTASLWTADLPSGVGNPPILKLENLKGRIILDGLYRQIKTGQDLIFVYDNTLFTHRAELVEEVTLQITPDTEIPTDGDPITVKGASAPATLILLSGFLAPGIVKSKLVIHYGLVNAGTVTVDPVSSAAPNAARSLGGPLQLAPGESAPGRIFLTDAFETAVEVGGVLDPGTGLFTPDGATQASPALHPTITLHGNLANASRGESVRREVLGSGKGAVSHQRFTLAKKPLTFLAAPSTLRGVTNTLVVYVDGVRWREVPGFFGMGPGDRVYIVRLDDQGGATVIFGDGLRGRRLPTGSQVSADYRFGAGAASPPSGSITQLARPTQGLSGVANPIAAAGGAEAEPAENMRGFAPKSALVLGRAVSIQDLEALAMGAPGVRAAAATWRWHQLKQRAVAQIFYLGEPGIEADVSQRLRAVSDPALAIAVQPAMPIPIWMILDVRTSKNYRAEDVEVEVRAALLDPEFGLLAPERIGIGKPLFRSHIFEHVLGVTGVSAVRGINIYWWPFLVYAITPGEGAYFDFELGNLVLNVQEEA